MRPDLQTLDGAQLVILLGGSDDGVKVRLHLVYYVPQIGVMSGYHFLV